MLIVPVTYLLYYHWHRDREKHGQSPFAPYILGCRKIVKKSWCQKFLVKKCIIWCMKTPILGQKISGKIEILRTHNFCRKSAVCPSKNCTILPHPAYFSNQRRCFMYCTKDSPPRVCVDRVMYDQPSCHTIKWAEAPYDWPEVFAESVRSGAAVTLSRRLSVHVVLVGCRCPTIGLPQKSFPPADNLPAKIRPARRPPGRKGFLPVESRPGETFLKAVL